MAEGWKGITEYVPTPMNVSRWLYACPKPNCYMHLTVKTLEEAEQIAREHKCPRSGDTKIGWEVTKTLVQKVWDMLDVEYIFAIDDAAGELHRGRARALAEVLALFMDPFFTNADDVIREARRRYNAHKSGEEYVTPGLESRRYDFPSTVAEPIRRSYGPPKSTGSTALDKEIAKVSEADKGGIKLAMESGMFQADEVARMYKISASAVQAIIAT